MPIAYQNPFRLRTPAGVSPFRRSRPIRHLNIGDVGAGILGVGAGLLTGNPGVGLGVFGAADAAIGSGGRPGGIFSSSRVEPDRFFPQPFDLLQVGAAPDLRDRLIANAIATTPSPAEADSMRRRNYGGDVPEENLVRNLALRQAQELLGGGTTPAGTTVRDAGSVLTPGRTRTAGVGAGRLTANEEQAQQLLSDILSGRLSGRAGEDYQAYIRAQNPTRALRDTRLREQLGTAYASQGATGPAVAEIERRRLQEQEESDTALDAERFLALQQRERDRQTGAIGEASTLEGERQGRERAAIQSGLSAAGSSAALSAERQAQELARIASDINLLNATRTTLAGPQIVNPQFAPSPAEQTLSMLGQLAGVYGGISDIFRGRPDAGQVGPIPDTSGSDPATTQRGPRRFASGDFGVDTSGRFGLGNFPFTPGINPGGGGSPRDLFRSPVLQSEATGGFSFGRGAGGTRSLFRRRNRSFGQNPEFLGAN